MQTQVEKELTAIRREMESYNKLFNRLIGVIETFAGKFVVKKASIDEAIPKFLDEDDLDCPINIHGQILPPDDSIIAVDFDGTLCENKWPEIGEPILPMLAYVKKRKRHGARLILWTNRSGERLDEAVAWCAARGIAFNAVNENLPEIIQQFGSDCRKIYADEYIDDRAFNAINLAAKLS